MKCRRPERDPVDREYGTHVARVGRGSLFAQAPQAAGFPPRRGAIGFADPRAGVIAMFLTMRRHHHPVDAWEPDDADEIAEDGTIEEIRRSAEWDPWPEVLGRPKKEGETKATDLDFAWLKDYEDPETKE